jgi:phosphinothricin acetyltransferase
MVVVDKDVASPTSRIVLRPSSDDDVPAMLEIYRQHIEHGVGNLGAFEPTPIDADDLKARRKNMLKHRLPHLVATIDGVVAGYAVPQAPGLPIHGQAFDLRPP